VPAPAAPDAAAESAKAARDYRRRRGLSTIFTLMLMAAAFTPVVYVGNLSDPRRAAAKPDDILYLPRGSTLKYMTVGYNGVAADMTWIRSVLYVGRKLRRRDTNYEWMDKLYHVTTDLDPHWVRPYQAGAILLSALPQDDQRALDLYSKGMRHNGWNWNIPYGVAQLNLLRGRNREALKYLRLIRATMKGYPPFIGNTIAQLEKEGQDYERATRTAAEDLAKKDDRLVRAILTSTYRETLARLLELELSGANGWYKRIRGSYTGSVNELLSLPPARGRPSVREHLTERMTNTLGGNRDLAARIVARLPDDAFGMKFYVRPNGTVHSHGIERMELRRIFSVVNPYLKRFRERHQRNARSLEELVLYVRELARTGQLTPGARKYWGRLPKLPPHPAGPGSWRRERFNAEGLLELPSGPTAGKMLAAPYPIPLGPRERARRKRTTARRK
jgi:hypothetical protein